MSPSRTLILAICIVPILSCAEPGRLYEQANHRGSCASVFVLKPQAGIGPATDMHEVSLSVDDSAFVAKGKLFRRDWGAFEVCGQRVVLRFRSITSGFRVSGPSVIDVNGDIRLNIGSRKVAFVELGSKWAEVAEDRGLKIKAEIDANPGAPTVTGWEWIDRRELYYSKECQVKSERCP